METAEPVETAAPIETTWPTPRDGFAWGTSELALMRGHLDSDDEILAGLAERMGRRLTSVRVRQLRLRALLRPATP